jgi:hypothetical protein
LINPKISPTSFFPSKHLLITYKIKIKITLNPPKMMIKKELILVPNTNILKNKT